VEPTKPRIPVWVALLGSGFAGVLVAVQSRINGGFSQQLGNPYVTAAISFGVGLLVVSVAMLFTERGRKGVGLVRAELREGHLPWWSLVGGACGGFFVLTQGLIASLIGLALFTVGIVAGQVLGGLIFDRVGLGPGGRVDPTLTRMVGSALAIAAVAFTVFADIASPGGHASSAILIVVPMLAGAAVSFQSAVNGMLRAAAQSATAATFISFLIGTLVLVAAAIVSVAVSGWPTDWPSEPWHYVGGALGVVFIAIAAVFVRTAGVLLLSMSNVAGQLIASVALEAGLPLAGGVTGGMLLGAGVALIAVVIAALPFSRRGGR